MFSTFQESLQSVEQHFTGKERAETHENSWVSAHVVESSKKTTEMERENCLHWKFKVSSLIAICEMDAVPTLLL